jgi:hypothetical protein
MTPDQAAELIQYVRGIGIVLSVQAMMVAVFVLGYAGSQIIDAIHEARQNDATKGQDA